MTGCVVIGVHTSIVRGQQVRFRHSGRGQITLKSEIIHAQDVHGTGVLVNVVIKGGTDGRQTLTHRHIKTQTVVLHGVTSETFIDTSQCAIRAIKKEITRTSIDDEFIVSWNPHSQQGSVDVDGRTYPITLRRTVGCEVGSFGPSAVASG